MRLANTHRGSENNFGEETLQATIPDIPDDDRKGQRGGDR